MRKEFLAIVGSYLIGGTSLIAQWQSAEIDPMKEMQVLAVTLSIALCIYALIVTEKKCIVLVGLPSIIMAGWGGIKIILAMAGIILPVLIGGHAP